MQLSAAIILLGSLVSSFMEHTGTRKDLVSEHVGLGCRRQKKGEIYRW